MSWCVSGLMTKRRAPTSRVVSVGCALVSKDKAARLCGCRPWWRPTADPQGCWGEGVGGWTTQAEGVAPPLCVCRIATGKSGKSVLRPLRSASTRRLALKVAIGALVAGLASTGAAAAADDPMRPVPPFAQALDTSGRQELPGGVDSAALYARPHRAGTRYLRRPRQIRSRGTTPLSTGGR